MNFSSEALGVVNDRDQSLSISKRRIEAANANELAKMESQLKQMQKLIRIQKRKRTGDDDDAQQGPSTRRKMSHNPAATAPEPKAIEAIDLTTNMEASGFVDNCLSPFVLENDVIEPGQVEPRAAEEHAASVTQAAVAENTVEAINHEAIEASESSAVANGSIAPLEDTADAVDQQADALVESAVCNAIKETTETGPDNNGVPMTEEKIANQSIDAALTPVSDTAKEGDELPAVLSITKPNPNGIETPETNKLDQPTSPIEAGAMNLD